MKDPYSIDIAMVRHIAALSTLKFDSAEEELFLKELNQILDHMKQLKTVNTDRLEGSFQLIATRNVTRQDEITPSLSPAETLQNAPESGNGFFKIPPILEA